MAGISTDDMWLTMQEIMILRRPLDTHNYPSALYRKRLPNWLN